MTDKNINGIHGDAAAVNASSAEPQAAKANSLAESNPAESPVAELNCTYETETEVSMINENGVLKPHAYQVLFAQVAEQHLNAFHANASHTMAYGVAWALISMTIEIEKQVAGCQKLVAQTWHSQHKGPYWRRELVFRDQAGDVVFQGSTFSVLLDMEKRSVSRKRDIPFFTTPPTPVFTIDAKPTLKSHISYSPVEVRKVRNSHIDMLGHVNNCRYGEFAYDALSGQEREKLAEMRRMEIYFASELRRGDDFTIGKATQGDKLYIRGHNNMKENTSFDIILSK